MRKLRPREVTQVCIGTQLGIKVSCGPLLLLCLHHLPPLQVPYLTYPHLRSPSPVPICCHTHEKGSQSGSSVLPRFSEIGIKKKMPLKLVRVAESCSLFLEAFLFSETVREEREGIGDGCREYIQNGLEQDAALTPAHSVTVY